MRSFMIRPEMTYDEVVNDDTVIITYPAVCRELKLHGHNIDNIAYSPSGIWYRDTDCSSLICRKRDDGRYRACDVLAWLGY